VGLPRTNRELSPREACARSLRARCHLRRRTRPLPGSYSLRCSANVSEGGSAAVSRAPSSLPVRPNPGNLCLYTCTQQCQGSDKDGPATADFHGSLDACQL
jgi:hypothetical protein